MRMRLSRRAITALLAILASGTAVAQQALQGPERWEPNIRKFEEEDRKNPPPANAVVFVGSSSIVKWTTLQRDFPGVPVIQRGFGGSDLSDTLHFADRIVIPYRPKTVVVYAGDNDLSRGKTPDRVVSDYKALVAKVHQALPETRIAYIAIKPSLARWKLVDSVRAVNEQIRALAAKDRRLVFIDVFAPMLGPDGMPRKELFVQDGLHLSPEGYALWKGIVGPALQ
jgi:lysophospholipase L1-like esterase